MEHLTACCQKYAHRANNVFMHVCIQVASSNLANYMTAHWHYNYLDLCGNNFNGPEVLM